MSEPITLGEFIRLLEARKPEDGISFDFCGMLPTDVASYRGYYEQLAIGHREHSYGQEGPTVGSLLGVLRDAVGKTFHGYKGGEYRMTEQTPVWVANHGRCHGTAIVGLCDCDWATVIKTEWVDP